MQSVKIVDALFEATTEPKVDAAIQVEVDRLLLRLHSAPGLLGYLQGSAFKNGHLELDFYDLPKEALTTVRQLIGPFKTDVLQYQKKGQPHVGYRIAVVAPDQKSAPAPDQPAGSVPQSNPA